MTTYSTGETTKQKMIDAAGTLAGDLGLDNVSTRAVADVSGENIGSIHYHFGGKDGLFEAVVRDAIGYCVQKNHYKVIDELDAATATPQELSKVVRCIVSDEITDLFRSDRPRWHTQVIYQLLQRDDALFDIFTAEVMGPGMKAMSRFFRIIDPKMTEDEVFLRTVILKMPIFSHAYHMKMMLKRLDAESYPEAYLQKMEDLLVRQTQLVLELPED